MPEAIDQKIAEWVDFSFATQDIELETPTTRIFATQNGSPRGGSKARKATEIDVASMHNGKGEPGSRQTEAALSPAANSARSLPLPCLQIRC
jgi:hypothetical protein